MAGSAWAGAVLGAASVLPAGACVVLQEFGQPTGYGNSSSVDGGSEALSVWTGTSPV